MHGLQELKWLPAVSGAGQPWPCTKKTIQALEHLYVLEAWEAHDIHVGKGQRRAMVDIRESTDYVTLAIATGTSNGHLGFKMARTELLVLPPPSWALAFSHFYKWQLHLPVTHDLSPYIR